MSDLTVAEQERVRLALRFLRAKVGAKPLAKALHADLTNIRRVLDGHEVNASLAFRVAKLGGVSIGDLLAGALPPAGTCPKCGHHEDGGTTAGLRTR